MSEYQYVAFRAIEQPVTGKNLDYMHRQSSRADITPWSFENEYHYGDFRGDAIEMLRRGYDLHLHYASFGIRKLMIRLPSGLPDPRMFKFYSVKQSLHFIKDKTGPGGCLCIEPYYDSVELEQLWDIPPLVDALVTLRAEILDGDLRPLYLAHLAVASDSDHDPGKTHEAPVPGGLDELTEAQKALVGLYGIDDELIAAAARESLRRRDFSGGTQVAECEEWIRCQPESSKNAWLTALMADASSAVRSEILSKYRAEAKVLSWPTTRPNRTLAELQATAANIAQERKQRAAEKAAEQRRKRLARMAADPSDVLLKTEQLVAKRTTADYQKVAELLAELREALAGSKQSDLAEKQAEKLKSNNPTLKMLTGELRRHGFVLK